MKYIRPFNFKWKAIRKTLRRDKNKLSGDLLICINENIPFSELNYHTQINNIQHIVIELNIKKQKLLVICLYVPPNQN